jgi:lipopolysaccharide/colanic/teichoic acid biosynthesis glycosyltransferase
MKNSLIIRIIDFLISLFAFIVFFPFFILIMLICFLETGRPLFFQERLGRFRKPFILIKFPTMKADTPSIATHMVDPSCITKFGRIIRKAKLDELPQLCNVLKGDMSLVGPRPCLPNQEELIKERTKRGVFEFRPGITGLAQINNIDMSDPKLLAEIDEKMMKSLNLGKYFSYIILTALGKGLGDRVRTPHK